MAQLIACLQRVTSDFRSTPGANMLELAKIVDVLCIAWVAGWTVFEAGRHENPDLVQEAVALLAAGGFLLSLVSAASVLACF